MEGNPTWITCQPDPATSGYETWSHTFNTTQYQGQNLTFYIRSFDGLDYSDELSITLTVDAPGEGGEDGGDGGGSGSGGKSASSDTSTSIQNILIVVVIVIVLVVVLAVLMFMNKKKKDKLAEEERRRREEEARRHAAYRAGQAAGGASISRGPVSVGPAALPVVTPAEVIPSGGTVPGGAATAIPPPAPPAPGSTGPAGPPTPPTVLAGGGAVTPDRMLPSTAGQQPPAGAAQPQAGVAQVPPGAAGTSAPTGDGTKTAVEAIAELGSLHAKGVISDEEFEISKRRMLRKL
jgi:hypothetical protein